jgi:ribosomal protein S18 acetylase RimI-like enzyme
MPARRPSLPAGDVEIRPVDPEHPDARRCLAAYFGELEARSHGPFDPSTGSTAEPDELRPPHGVLLLAYLRGTAMGCGALKHHPDGSSSDIKRMWVDARARGSGLGRRLLAELERRAVEHGDRAVQLETNALLVEAIALYRRAGFVEVAAFNDEPFADHWFRKDLQVAAGPE